MLEKLRAKVKRGAALLDEECPGWAVNVALDQLAMRCCDDCILGQVYGYYYEGLEALSLYWGLDHGFSIDIASPDSLYDTLADLWRIEVLARTSTEAIPALPVLPAELACPIPVPF